MGVGRRGSDAVATWPRRAVRVVGTGIGGTRSMVRGRVGPRPTWAQREREARNWGVNSIQLFRGWWGGQAEESRA